MDEAKHKITRRHIARLLTLLESMGATQEMITSVKGEMWDMHNDLVESKESNEGEKNWIGSRQK